ALGLPLVDGRICGVGIILGEAPDSLSAKNLIRELQTKHILSFLVGGFKEQLDKENVVLGLESYIVPLGKRESSLVYAADFIGRTALSFGGLKRGNSSAIFKHIKERIPAFTLALGALSEEKISYLAGLIRLGIPVITDQNVETIIDSEATLHEALVVERDYGNIGSKAIQTRGIKIKIEKIDIPVNYSPAFEGERIRKEMMFCEFGGKKSIAFEFLKTKNLEEIKDGEIEILGLDLDQMEEKNSYPLAIWVEVAGRKMQEDFEPVLERQIHRFLNYAQGVAHLGQRDAIWLRVSKEAKELGLSLRDFGKILHAKFHDEYSNIVDKVKVKIVTAEDEVKELLLEAGKAYKRRDEKLLNLKDEDVPEFYSCLLCSSFAPNHACVITPQRSGLCGAISFLDAKTAYELLPTGGNRPIEKKGLLDAKKGEWGGVNEFIYQASHQTIKRLCLYSLIQNPMTSCGCFECIVAVVPEANGVMIVNREYSGMTPVGMKFSTLAGMTGGGQQTPGFMGISRRYITSEKFIKAEGGLKRVVWMPKELKEKIAPDFQKRAEELGIDNFLDKIADETIAVEISQLLDFLKSVQHPALTLEPIM
ncbi:MAG: acetyl-CoA decarbonylase/synthase complex subunit alpha/beta, partial [Candidatus Omnitrophica bacterium]|nr:acetyl-CoA decarbonylase/synthase complex subunit alpha/beta [Candidatus Omnitrophota bacterium]